MTPKRTVPDYEGRPPPPATAGQAALWVPRIVFFPLWLTSEFVLRRPMGAFLMAAERNNWPTALYDFFAFGPDHKAGFAPLVLADFGFNPSVGLYLFWDDAGFKGNDLSVHGATWGEDWIAGSVTERFRFKDKKVLTLTFDAACGAPTTRSTGIGPALARRRAKSRYGEDLLDAQRESLGRPNGARGPHRRGGGGEVGQLLRRALRRRPDLDASGRHGRRRAPGRVRSRVHGRVQPARPDARLRGRARREAPAPESSSKGSKGAT